MSKQRTKPEDIHLISPKMVAPVAFPIAKLGVLLVKQISKPLAKSISNKAKSYKLLRNWIIIPTGQIFHYCNVRLKISSLNLRIKNKVTKVPKLSENDAIEQGSAILSEIIILSTAIGVLVYEYGKSKIEKQEEENMKIVEKEILKNKLFDLEVTIEKHNASLFALAKSVVKTSEKYLGKQDTDIQKLKEIIDEEKRKIEGKKEIKPIIFSEIEEESKASKKSNEKTDKSLTDEFVDFVEEVVEEVLDAVNPEDE